MFFRKKKKPLFPEDFPLFDDQAMHSELHRRLGLPQRHRLLQGFPMRRLMNKVDEHWHDNITSGFGRWPHQAIVGVLPHPFCVPAVKGCGFCTFPHEQYEKETMMPLAKTIAFDIATHPAPRNLRVPSLYFGGGTANLVSDEALEWICTSLLARFGFVEEEVSLEGVPRFFRDAHFELMKSLGAKRTRISMGVQTFDEAWLAKMGRLKIGAPLHVEDALALAKKHGAQTSIDLLINMPGQTLDQMHRDIDHALALNLDQICVYHLVLFAGLGTEWSKDPKMLAELPNNEDAFEHWKSVRQRLLNEGYVQTTLTNFEKKSIPHDERFHYESYSFTNAQGAGLGFGPGAITHSGHRQTQSFKWQNATDAREYLSSKKDRYLAPAFYYAYAAHEQTLSELTRSLAGLRLSAQRRETFAQELSLLEDEGLLSLEHDTYRPTERGMFFADSIAGILSHRSVLFRRQTPETLFEAQAIHMG